MMVISVSSPWDVSEHPDPSKDSLRAADSYWFTLQPRVMILNVLFFILIIRNPATSTANRKGGIHIDKSF
jgi:hypothetical protein